MFEFGLLIQEFCCSIFSDFLKKILKFYSTKKSKFKKIDLLEINSMLNFHRSPILYFQCPKSRYIRLSLLKEISRKFTLSREGDLKICQGFLLGKECPDSKIFRYFENHRG